MLPDILQYKTHSSTCEPMKCSFQIKKNEPESVQSLDTAAR